MSIADPQDRAEALGRPGGIANFAEAAPGVERSEAPTISHGEGSLYTARTKIYPKRAHGTFSATLSLRMGKAHDSQKLTLRGRRGG